jgi:hypothetical protein
LSTHHISFYLSLLREQPTPQLALAALLESTPHQNYFVLQGYSTSIFQETQERRDCQLISTPTITMTVSMPNNREEEETTEDGEDEEDRTTDDSETEDEDDVSAG